MSPEEIISCPVELGFIAGIAGLVSSAGRPIEGLCLNTRIVDATAFFTHEWPFAIMGYENGRRMEVTKHEAIGVDVQKALMKRFGQDADLAAVVQEARNLIRLGQEGHPDCRRAA